MTPIFAPFFADLKPSLSLKHVVLTALLCGAVGTRSGFAQDLQPASDTSVSSSAEEVSAGENTARPTLLAAALPEAPLPEAPQPQVVTPKPDGINPQGQHVTPLYAKYVPAGWHAQPLTARDKIIVGAKDLYSVDNFGAMFLSAGYEHLFNSLPNYGTDKGAFGERLGAAAVRETSQGVFTDMVFAPLLHEDSRYFQDGIGHSFFHRTFYAITRPLVTRKDDGGSTVNGALLLGYAASAALTPAFYPASNRNAHDALSTYGGSVGGAALGFFISEFSPDVLAALHLRHNF